MDSVTPPSDREIFSLISELSQAIRCCQQERFFCENITFSQFFILDAISEKGQMKLAELHKVLAVEKSTTTRLVGPLVRQGLIVRERSGNDSRALNLRLTKKGEGVHRRVWECLSGFLESVRSGIARKERKSVYLATRIFVTALRNACARGYCQE